MAWCMLEAKMFLNGEIMEIDVKIIAALVALSGIFITTLFGVVGYIFKLRQDRKKSTRTVLYLLLEIRHSLLKAVFNPFEATNKYMEHYDKKLRDRGIDSASEDENLTEFIEQMKQVLILFFTNIVESQNTDIRVKLLEPYEKALSELATINPVLAYLLKGHENLELLLPHTETHIENVHSISDSFVEEKWVKDVLRNTSSKVSSKAIDTLIENLEANILLVAKSCSRKDRKHCKRLLEKGLNKDNQYNFEDLDDTIELALEHLVEQLKQQAECLNSQPDVHTSN